MERHDHFVNNSKVQAQSIKVLFLGDSITEGWNEEGNATFHKYYGKNVANYGISSDKTQHLLWRIRNGELDNLSPFLVILLIGTNNFASNTDTEIFKGVKANVLELRRRLPSSKILLIGILPKGSDTGSKRVNTINKQITQLDDDLMIFYFDLGKYFYIEDHMISELYHPDLLHLSSKGYETWALAAKPIMKEMMEVIYEKE
jgi:lysophospholipase L1-like esterase